MEAVANKLRRMKPVKLILSIVWVVTAMAAMGQKPEVFSTEEGAIGGYDPVAFFKESKPVMGTKELILKWNDAEWHFASQENLEAFKANPEQYAPQFGGWCVYGTAAGHKSPTVPETWAIIDNKLYFNYNTAVQKLFNKNQKGLIEQANKNWPTVKKE
jgi:YHS domain-containing protein